jgi:hypothetical protein
MSENAQNALLILEEHSIFGIYRYLIQKDIEYQRNYT